jgi:hypothetical protein
MRGTMVFGIAAVVFLIASRMLGLYVAAHLIQ